LKYFEIYILSLIFLDDNNQYILYPIVIYLVDVKKLNI